MSHKETWVNRDNCSSGTHSGGESKHSDLCFKCQAPHQHPARQILLITPTVKYKAQSTEHTPTYHRAICLRFKPDASSVYAKVGP